MKIVIFSLIALLISFGMVTQSYAHTTVEVGSLEIEAGWGIEPPVVGIRNDWEAGSGYTYLVGLLSFI